MKKYLRAAMIVSALSAMLAASPALAVIIHTHDTPHKPFDQKIRTAQMRLADLGYFTGYPDGINGPRTRKAIINFQRIHGLHANGQLTQKTYKLILLTDYMAHRYYLSS